MAAGDDDYGDAFKTARLEHDQQREGPTEAKRLQAEVDADAAVLSNVVLPQLQAAAQKLEPLGGKVEIRQYGRTGKTLRPSSVAFRIADRQDQQDQPGYGKGHESRAYLIVPRGGTVIVTSGNGFDVSDDRGRRHERDLGRWHRCGPGPYSPATKADRPGAPQHHVIGA